MNKKIFALAAVVLVLLAGCRENEKNDKDELSVTETQKVTSGTETVAVNIQTEISDNSDYTVSESSVLETVSETTVVQTELSETSETVLNTDSIIQESDDEGYKKAYAEYIFENYVHDGKMHDVTPCIIHLNSDQIPELLLCYVTNNYAIYSYNGKEIYKAGEFGAWMYNGELFYRPYLGQLSSRSGSVMYGDVRRRIYTVKDNSDGTFSEECTYGIFRSHPESEDMINPEEVTLVANELSDDELSFYMNTYDIDEHTELGDSWMDASNGKIDFGVIEYWMNNG